MINMGSETHINKCCFLSLKILDYVDLKNTETTVKSKIVCVMTENVSVVRYREKAGKLDLKNISLTFEFLKKIHYIYVFQDVVYTNK